MRRVPIVIAAAVLTAIWAHTIIRFGGAGSWGVVPMISYPALSDEEIQAITRWILNPGDEAARN